MNNTEIVLAVPTEDLQGYLTHCGLISENTDKIVETIMTRHTFLPRPEAELDPSHRQIIPYVAILRGGEVFSTRRLKGGTEGRLHGRISLGVGGHINPDSDGDGDDVLMRALYREIDEEVCIENLDMTNLHFRGFINDDSNEVGSVHLGFFCTLEVTGEVTVRETEKLCGAWLAISSLPELSSEMETWSSLVAGEL